MAAVTSEPRRRDRLPEEAMSEGASHRLSEAPVWLESLGRLFAKRTPRPKAAGPDVGATLRAMGQVARRVGTRRFEAKLR